MEPVAKLEILDIDRSLLLSLQVLAEIIDHTPVEVLVVVLEVVLLAWHDKQVEALACTDQFVDYADGIGRMYVVVYIAMNNDEAAAVNNEMRALHTYSAGYNPLYYLWDGTKAKFAGRFGANIDFRITDAVSVGAELQANTLSDKYNSKRAYNTDWYFNALVGVKVNLGKTYTERVIPAAEPEVRYVEKVVEKIVEKPVTVTEVRREPLRRDIFFTINSTVISKAESVKVQDIADYLNKYADAKVVISGYADAGTGNDKINDRLAAQRADRVKKALVEKYGIAESRITYDSHGSRVQPFQQNDKNRVSICIAE